MHPAKVHMRTCSVCDAEHACGVNYISESDCFGAGRVSACTKKCTYISSGSTSKERGRLLLLDFDPLLIYDMKLSSPHTVMLKGNSCYFLSPHLLLLQCSFQEARQEAWRSAECSSSHSHPPHTHTNHHPLSELPALLINNLLQICRSLCTSQAISSCCNRRISGL